MSSIYQGRSGKAYRVSSNPLARGGEGSIFAIDENPNLVLKVFRADRRTSDREEKLIKMVKYQLNEVQLFQVTWPQDVVYDQNGFVGYIMPRLRDNQNLNAVYSTQANHFDLRHRMVIAFNLCVAIDTIHSINQVCGDLNPQNICVDLNMKSSHALCVTLVDTDSYHITDYEKIYRCEVGLANYIAPEVQKKLNHGMNLRNAPLPTYTRETDLFALAVHIFSLVMNGCHPFACAKKTNNGYEHNIEANQYKNVESVVLPQPIDNIKDGFFPFHQHREGVTYPLYAPDFQNLPKDLRTMFIRAFEDGYKEPKKRPTAEEWMAVLGKYQAAMEYSKCQRGHYYFKNELMQCPFCEANQRMMQMLSGASFVNRNTVNSSTQHNNQDTTSTTVNNGFSTSVNSSSGMSKNQNQNRSNVVNNGNAPIGNNNSGTATNQNQSWTNRKTTGSKNEWLSTKVSNYDKLLLINGLDTLKAVLLIFVVYAQMFISLTFICLFVFQLIKIVIGKTTYLEYRKRLKVMSLINGILFCIAIYGCSPLIGLVGAIYSVISTIEYYKNIQKLEKQQQKIWYITGKASLLHYISLVIYGVVAIITTVFFFGI